MAVKLDKRKISWQAYHLLYEAGIFSDEDKTELLDGEIIDMSPIGNPHAGAVNRINHALAKKLLDRSVISIQNPVKIGEFSEPEPDITLCYFKDHFYSNIRIEPKDVILLIEVSDSTLEKDREVKLPIYAEAGILCYWIVNLEERQIEVYTEPEGRMYKNCQIIKPNDLVSIPVFNLEIYAKEILGE